MIRNDLCFITWNFDPTIFEFNIFGHEFPIGLYGFLFALAFFVGQMVMTHIFKRDGKSMGDLDSLTIKMVVGTVIGARLGHYLFYEWEYLCADPLHWFTSLITPPYAGLASHGATIGIILAIYFYARKRPDQPILWVLDRIVIVASFAGFIRIGNFLNSEIYGTPTNLPWGVKFMAETNPQLLPVVPRHPTQIYEFLFCVLLFAITFWMWKKKRHVLPNGIIFCTFTILLFTFRFFIEFLKNDQSQFEANMFLNMGQVLSIPLVIGSAILLFYLHRKRKTSSNEVTDHDFVRNA
jgi:prolipoprotein diacylglyceryl transferase